MENITVRLSNQTHFKSSLPFTIADITAMALTKNHCTISKSLRRAWMTMYVCCAKAVHGSFLNRRIIILPRLLTGCSDWLEKAGVLSGVLKMSDIGRV